MKVRTLFALVVAGASCAAADAAPLNLNLLAYPDISSTQIDVTYDASTLLLSASGFAIGYEDDGLGSTPPHSIFSGIFALSMTVSHAGVASGGTLTIGGSIPDLSIPNQTLLSGLVTNFGFTTSGAGRLEIVCGTLGGALGPAFLARGSEAGVILNNVTGFPFNFNTSWDNLVNGQPGTGNAVSDTGVVPAPSAVALVGLGGLVAVRRRRQPTRA